MEFNLGGLSEYLNPSVKDILCKYAQERGEQPVSVLNDIIAEWDRYQDLNNILGMTTRNGVLELLTRIKRLESRVEICEDNIN